MAPRLLEQGGFQPGIRPAQGVAPESLDALVTPLRSAWRFGVQPRQGCRQRLVRTQPRTRSEGLAGPVRVTGRQRQLPLQAPQHRVRRATCHRLVQRGPCFVEAALREQELRPCDVGEHVVRQQLEVGAMPALGRGDEAEQLELAGDLHLAEAHLCRLAQGLVGLQRIGQATLLLVQVSQRCAAVIVIAAQAHGVLVAFDRRTHVAQAIACIAKRGPGRGVVWLAREQSPCQRRTGLGLVGITVVQAGACAQRATEAGHGLGRVRRLRQGLPVQRDRTFVVVGLADAGVIRRTRQRRRTCGCGGLRSRREREPGKPPHDDHRHNRRRHHHMAHAPWWWRHCCRQCSSAGFERERGLHQLVTLPAHRTQIARPPRIVAQRLAQQLDPLGHGFLADHGRRPDRLDQLVEADHALAPCQQVDQQLETQPGHVQQLTITADPLARYVDLQVKQAVVRGHPMAARERGMAQMLAQRPPLDPCQRKGPLARAFQDAGTSLFRGCSGSGLGPAPARPGGHQRRHGRSGRSGRRGRAPRS